MIARYLVTSLLATVIALSISLCNQSRAWSSDVVQPKLGSPERTALLDGLRATDTMKATAKEWKIPKVIFYDVKNFEKDGWAYVQARPGSQDQKHTTEPVQGVMHKVGGKWQWVDFTSDEIPPAENPDAEFKKWQNQFVKDHKGCPPEIFPAKF